MAVHKIMKAWQIHGILSIFKDASKLNSDTKFRIYLT